MYIIGMQKMGKLSRGSRYISMVCWQIHLLYNYWAQMSYAIWLLSYFIRAQCTAHINVVWRIHGYMRPTVEKGILYKVNCHLAIQAFLGTDWHGFSSHHHFVFGYVGGIFMTWKRSNSSKFIPLLRKLLGFVSQILQFLWKPKEICSYLWNKSNLQLNLRIQVWILSFDILILSKLSVQLIHFGKNNHNQMVKFINFLLPFFFSISISKRFSSG